MKNLSLAAILFVTVLFFACRREKANYVDLQLLSKNLTEVMAQYEARNAQELNAKKVKNVSSSGIKYLLEDHQLLLQLEENQASITFNTELLNFPGSLKEYHEIIFEFENRSNMDIKINIVLWGPRGRLPDTVMVASRESIKKSIDLHDLPLIGNPTKKYYVDRMQFQFDNTQSAEIILKSIALIQKPSKKDLVVVDQFGQRKSTNWPGKVRDGSELKTHLENEHATLANLFDQASFDKYKGYKTGKKYESNGYFSVGSEKINGKERWFFITPEGDPFWSLGVTGIRPKKPMHAVTMVKGNEQLFEEPPDRNGPYASAYIDSTLSFYYVNLLRKYGSMQGWRDMSLKRLKSWGLNTIGNWAEDSLLNQSDIPFTYSFETDIKSWKKDVFHPGWEAYVDSVFSKASSMRENKYLLGYFVDNEAGWGNLKLLQTLPEDAFLRKAWSNQLEKKYGKIQSFNEKNESSFTDFSDIAELASNEGIPQEDILLLEEIYTDKYFGTIAETLDKYDPNHMYMGCRFTRKLKPAHILEIAGKHCDVITVNVYSYEPIKKDMDQWHALTGKPILIGEHQAALKSRRQLPLRWQTFNEEERYEYFTNYVSKWAHMPYSLGSHWYQYSDQHITGRASNGENQIIGFVDITDQPYQRMIDAARYNFEHIYEWMGFKQKTALQ